MRARTRQIVTCMSDILVACAISGCGASPGPTTGATPPREDFVTDPTATFMHRNPDSSNTSSSTAEFDSGRFLNGH